MSTDFFSRMIATQQQGPNLKAGSSEESCLILYVCPSCDDEHEDEDDARECCPRHIYEIYRCTVCRKKHQDEDEAIACHPGHVHAQPMQCPVCLESADSFQIAVDCCLHVHPTITAAGRARIATAVANGMPWPEAVQTNINH
jgi:hypothetical protein